MKKIVSLSKFILKLQTLKTQNQIGMKKIVSLFAFSLFSIFSFAQTICNSGGNLIIFTNYDGGPLNISVDVNIPNLKIGVVGYHAVAVNISGTFASNVTGIAYAGYNAGATCGFQAISTTSFSGLPTGATSNIAFLPQSTLANSNGNNSIVCGYSCNLNSNQGGCNTADQVEAYFMNFFPNSVVYAHKIQYNCWSGTQTISTMGNCCATVTPLSATGQTQNTSCSNLCNGSITLNVGGGQSPYSYLWSNSATTASLQNLCAGSYTVTITDAAQATTTQSFTITAPAPITAFQSFTECEGFSVQVGNSVYSASGLFIDTLSNSAGCDSIVSTQLTIKPNGHFTQTFTPSRCDNFSVSVGTSVYTENGEYIDTLFAGNGCDSIVVTQIQKINTPTFAASPIDTVINMGSPVAFEVDSPALNATIQWQEDSGNGFVDLSDGTVYSGSQTAVLQISQADLSFNNRLYRAQINLDMCNDTTQQALLTVRNTTGIAGLEKVEMQVYPNPVKTTLNVLSNQNTVIQIIDINGSVVLNAQLQNGDNRLDVQYLAPGVYTVLGVNTHLEPIRFIKE